MLSKIKKLLSTLIEKIFTSRKQWISEQSTISTKFTETQCIADGSNHTFIMPYTGYAVIKGFGVQYIDINSTVLVNGGFLVNSGSAQENTKANFNLSLNVYLKKGQESYYNIGQGNNYNTSYIRFYNTTSNV